ncbi:MAG: CHAT domain-containing protein [Rhodomicrobium sp.]
MNLKQLVAAIATEAIGLLHRLVTSEPDLSQFSGQASATTRHLAGLLWQARRYGAIAGTIENGRGVRLRAELVRAEHVPAGLSLEESAQYRDAFAQERGLHAQIEGLRASLAGLEEQRWQLSGAGAQSEPAAELLPNTLAQLNAGQENLRGSLAGAQSRLFELSSSRQRFEARDPNFDPPAPDFAALKAIAARGQASVVYLYPVSDGLGTFWQVIHESQGESPSGEDQGMVASLAFSKVQSLLFNAPQEEDGKAGEPLGWLQAHLGWLSSSADTKASAEASANARERWFSSIDRVLGVLGRELLTPVAGRLQELGAKRVVLIPGGVLGYLPLHAAPLADGSRFGDVFEVYYSPSANLLKRSLEQLPKSRPPKPHLAAIANPDRSLAFADGQVRAIARLFAPEATDVVYGTKARREWLLNKASTADYLELSTHASFNLNDPARSAFSLAHPDGRYQQSRQSHVQLARRRGEGSFEALTLSDIWQGQLSLKPGCMVAANACESGFFDLKPEALEEQLGFPAAFLSAGASTVIASFSSVSDFSTAVLMEAVYQKMLQNGMVAVKALTEASQELRSLTAAEVIGKLAAERPPIVELMEAAKAAKDGESYIACQMTLEAIGEEQARLARQDPASLPFAHPFYWAAFGVFGAQAPSPPLGHTPNHPAKPSRIWWK